MLRNKVAGEGKGRCVLDLENIYSEEEYKKFDVRWNEFLASDKALASVVERVGQRITYPHKSWIPTKKDDRQPILFLFGNPAPHSVKNDIYFSYEGKNLEHRFWRVMRELEFININTDPAIIKQDFFNLKYESPFRLGFEVIYSFPSPASTPKWSGVSGLYRLFGKKVMEVMVQEEKARLLPLIREFTEGGGAIIAMQKDAYNSVGQNNYSLDRALNFELKSDLVDSIKVYGTPPTRWLYTRRMKELLRRMRADILESGQIQIRK